MGESMVETPAVDKKMDEPVKSGGGLEVSVSFGRFENDALSWEKWSSFSPNKYLEEVGSLSTPGSVAQKKAYFEAHYKKIAAAKKAEESELENSTNSLAPIPDEWCSNDHIKTPATANSAFGLSNDASFVEENAQMAHTMDLTNVTIVDVAKDDKVRSGEARMNGLVGVVSSEEEEDTVVAVECGRSVTKETKDELNGSVVNSELTVGEESMLVGTEIPRKDSPEIAEKDLERKSGEEHLFVLEKESCKIKVQNLSQKIITPTKKDRNSVQMRKGIASPAVKPSQASTPKYSKPTSTSTPIPASQLSKKKVNGSPPPKSKNLLVVERKRVAPTSLHMSMSLGHAHPSAAAIPLTRKSLIMESMGDKDIVKRAFKSFQNRTYGSSLDEKSSTVKQVPSTPLKPKVPAFFTPRKGNEGPRKDVEKVATPRSQSGTRSKPFPSRSDRSSAVKFSTAASPSVGLRSDERAEKRKEFLKNLEAKSVAREAENAQRSAKSKEEKESEIKKFRQSLNFKATPIPSFYRGQGKRHPEKESAHP